MKTLDSKENISLLVDLFYKEVQTDQLIGPVFHAVIKSDDWPKHLERMSDFWETVLHGKGSYRGNPFMKHKDLGISTKHFNQWIELFKKVIQREFNGDKADEALMRANKMSALFQAKLEYIRNNPNTTPLI